MVNDTDLKKSSRRTHWISVAGSVMFCSCLFGVIADFFLIGIAAIQHRQADVNPKHILILLTASGVGGIIYTLACIRRPGPADPQRKRENER
jgi:hypothetical protein